MDVNVYDDIANFDLGDEIEKLKTENRLLDEHIKSLETEIEKLTAKNTQLETREYNLINNMSSLLLTSQAELERKDRMIADLRTKLDDMHFRRNTSNLRFKRKEPEHSNVESNEAKKIKSECRDGEVVELSKDETHRKDKSRSTSVESRFDRFKEVRGTEERLKNDRNEPNKHHNQNESNWETFDRENGADYKNRGATRSRNDLRVIDKRNWRDADHRRFAKHQRDEENIDHVRENTDRMKWGDIEHRNEDERDRRFYDKEREDERRQGDNYTNYNFDNRWDRGRCRPRWTNERHRFNDNDRFRYENRDFEWNYSRHEERIHFERQQYARSSTPPFPPIDNVEYKNRYQYRRMQQERDYREHYGTHPREIDRHHSRHSEQENTIDDSRSVSHTSLTENEKSKTKPVKKKLKMLEEMEEKIKRKRSSLTNQSDSQNESSKNVLSDLGNDFIIRSETEISSDNLLINISETHRNSDKNKNLEKINQKVGENFKKMKQVKTRHSTDGIKSDLSDTKELNSLIKDNKSMFKESKIPTNKSFTINHKHENQASDGINLSDDTQSTIKKTSEAKDSKKRIQKKIPNDKFDIQEFAESILFSIPHKIGGNNTDLLKDDAKEQDVRKKNKLPKESCEKEPTYTEDTAQRRLSQESIKKDPHQIASRKTLTFSKYGKNNTSNLGYFELENKNKNVTAQAVNSDSSANKRNINSGNKTMKSVRDKSKNFDKEKLSAKQLDSKKEIASDKIKEAINEDCNASNIKETVKESKISPKSLAKMSTCRKDLAKKAKLKNNIPSIANPSIESENSTALVLKVEPSKIESDNSLPRFKKKSKKIETNSLPLSVETKEDEKEETKENKHINIISNNQPQDSTTHLSKGPIKLRRSFGDTIKIDSDNKQLDEGAAQNLPSSGDDDKKEENTETLLKDKFPEQTTSGDKQETKQELSTEDKRLKENRGRKKSFKESFKEKIEKLFGEIENTINRDIKVEEPIKHQKEEMVLKKVPCTNEEAAKIKEKESKSELHRKEEMVLIKIPCTNKETAKTEEIKDESKSELDTKEIQKVKLTVVNDSYNNGEDGKTKNEKVLQTEVCNDDKMDICQPLLEESSHVNNDDDEVKTVKVVNVPSRETEDTKLLAPKKPGSKKSKIKNDVPVLQDVNVSVEKENSNKESTIEPSEKISPVVGQVIQPANIDNEEVSKESVDAKLTKECPNAKERNERNKKDVDNSNKDIVNKVDHVPVAEDVLKLERGTKANIEKDSELILTRKEDSTPKERSLKENVSIKKMTIKKVNDIDTANQRKDLSLINKQVDNVPVAEDVLKLERGTNIENDSELILTRKEDSTPKECNLKENVSIKKISIKKGNNTDIANQRKDLSLINKQVELEGKSLAKPSGNATKPTKEPRKEIKKKGKGFPSTDSTASCKGVDVSKNNGSTKITPESAESSSSEEAIQSEQRAKKGMKSIYEKFDTLIEAHLKVSEEKISNATDNKKSDKDETDLKSTIEVPVSKPAREIQTDLDDSNKSMSVSSIKASAIKTIQSKTPDKTVTRRRITPTPVKDNKPICSFENILEKTAKSSFRNSNSTLHLTHEGEIPVLHLDENHINNLPTECNINDKNIMSLLDSMNLSNIEGDMTKFKSIPTETKLITHDFTVNVSPIKGNGLTFENVINTVTSTPIKQTDGDVKKTESAPVFNKLPEKKVVNRLSLATPVRRRRRCRLVIID